jgi:hypothetical protein
MTYEFSFGLKRPTGGRITRHKSEFGDYLDGSVLTPHGIVDTYSQQGDPHTSLTFVWKGRGYVRNRNVTLTARGLVTAAARFAAEVAIKQGSLTP